MRKTISVKWLENAGACGEAIEKFENQKIRDTEKILRLLVKRHKWAWGSWLCEEIMTSRQLDKWFELPLNYNERPRLKNDLKILGVKNIKW